MKPRLTVEEYVRGVEAGDRIILAKAITLAESHLPPDRIVMGSLMDAIISKTGKSIRIGITGVPGVGKSTFIESFGKYITQTHKKKVAVLTVDPSSQISKGSILGDKTRMEELAKNPMAFIRPSSAGETLGGLTVGTRAAIHLCEAAGYEIVIVETIGVGQSETAVKKTVDFLLLLMLAGAGDELQGIKKGIMEMADALVITKADGDNKNNATRAQAEHQHALHLLRQDNSEWIPKVLTCSALRNEGMDTIWQALEAFQNKLKGNGFFEKKRHEQQIAWMQECFYDLVKSEIINSKAIADKTITLEKEVFDYKKTPQKAAQELLETLIRSLKS